MGDNVLEGAIEDRNLIGLELDQVYKLILRSEKHAWRCVWVTNSANRYKPRLQCTDRNEVTVGYP
jgi:hypothetical protein